MKVIFLDFDGVINSAEFMKIRSESIKGKKVDAEYSEFDWYLSMINEAQVALVNQIIEATGAKVVVSST